MYLYEPCEGLGLGLVPCKDGLLVSYDLECVCMAVARFDFSWGDPEYHQETLENLKAAVKSTKKLCAVCFQRF